MHSVHNGHISTNKAIKAFFTLRLTQALRNPEMLVGPTEFKWLSRWPHSS